MHDLVLCFKGEISGVLLVKKKTRIVLIEI